MHLRFCSCINCAADRSASTFVLSFGPTPCCLRGPARREQRTVTSRRVRNVAQWCALLRRARLRRRSSRGSLVQDKAATDILPTTMKRSRPGAKPHAAAAFREACLKASTRNSASRHSLRFAMPPLQLPDVRLQSCDGRPHIGQVGLHTRRGLPGLS